jgi:TolB protein
MFRKNFLLIFSALFPLSATTLQSQTAAPIGLFENHSDVGPTHYPGATKYDPAKKTYTLTASGENIWASTDAFHFVYKKISGDISLTADISLAGKSANPHRKAVLMFRASLDPDAPYVDVALHGDGLTSLQYREEKGGLTHEIRANVASPKKLTIERRGQYFTVWLASQDGKLQIATGSIRIPLNESFYAGLGVCSHDNAATEQATFSNVSLNKPDPLAAKPTLYSFLETISPESMNRTVEYIAPERFEAPNWTRDGATLIFNRNGHIELFKLNLGDSSARSSGGEPKIIDTGFANRCNNDHLISPDGASLAISDSSQESHESLVYTLPLAGGTPRRVTKNSPSYLHGWSPDGKTLAFVGARNNNFDIYSIPTTGGEETRLTTAEGLDDGPEYSPDGKFIYFNSERTGHMQIWRMRPDGSDQEQVTFDDFNNWFPHISPNGRQMVFLSFEKGVTGHPENKDVTLRLMSLPDKKITVLTTLFGGQGTINVPSWSPDSSQLAFVSYQLTP